MRIPFSAAGARILVPFGLLLAGAAAAQVPPVPVPPENPVTEPRRILGKILFWDEQLSSDDTVACGTCHIPSAGGADPRAGAHPGPDGLVGTDDDVVGSPGIARASADGTPLEDPVFGFGPQVTARSAQPFFNALWARELFWDGRARSTFLDPLDDAVAVVASGGGLESQAVGPILSSVEMAFEGRTWADVTGKLASVEPLALAYDLPPDVASALAGRATYADLFAAAFGDPEITPARIGLAIATYERTLAPDASPFDLFLSGDEGALTPAQRDAWEFLNTPPDEGGVACVACHTPPLFSDDDFHHIGLRPASEDPGRSAIDGDPEQFGDFKTPVLRNLGLRASLTHTGGIGDAADAVAFYNASDGHVQFPEDQDRIPGSGRRYDTLEVPVAMRAALVDFLGNALTDPRAAAETPPFDRPTLRSELPGMDPDADFVLADRDNCPAVANRDQRDADADGYGDACECGDANGDGAVGAADARLVQRYATGQIPAPSLCDATGDGACNTADARRILRYAVGQIPKHSLVCAERP